MLVGAPGYGNLGMVRWRRTVGSWMTPGTFGCWHRPAWLRLGTVLSSSKGKVTACARFTLALCETFFKAQQERVKQSRMGRWYRGKSCLQLLGAASNKAMAAKTRAHPAMGWGKQRAGVWMRGGNKVKCSAFAQPVWELKYICVDFYDLSTLHLVENQ